MAYFDGLTSDQVAALTTDQVAALTSADIQSLTSAQIQYLTTDAIVALSTDAVKGITTAAIPAMTTAQARAIETRDIASLESAQIGAFATDDLAALTTAQLSAIDASDITALNTAQLKALSTDQMAAFSASQVAGIADLSVGYNTEGVVVQGDNPVFLVTPTNGMQIVIPTGTTWSSGVLPMRGFNSAVVAILADKVLTVTVQRYVDAAGVLPVGAAGTLTSVANTAGYTSALSANVPATHFKVTVANASGATAVVSNFAIALQSN